MVSPSRGTSDVPEAYEGMAGAAADTARTFRLLHVPLLCDTTHILLRSPRAPPPSLEEAPPNAVAPGDTLG
ncbi:hypothetical protein GCM10009608_28450 [Pseudonocardia alaniniphila]